MEPRRPGWEDRGPSSFSTTDSALRPCRRLAPHGPHEAGVPTPGTCVGILPLALLSCVALGKALGALEPRFPPAFLVGAVGTPSKGRVLAGQPFALCGGRGPFTPHPRSWHVCLCEASSQRKGWSKGPARAGQGRAGGTRSALLVGAI